MRKKIKYPNEPIDLEIIRDFRPTPAELATIERSWLDEVHRRSAEFDAGKMKSTPAEEVFRRIRSRLKKRTKQ
jgi:putative addiction module component (TIGR02574 family)